MPRGEASILASYECARRAPLESNKWAYAKGAPRLKCAGEMFRCVTCNLDAVCRSCIKWCHVQKGHEVKGRKVEVAKKKGTGSGQSGRRLCECSLGPSCGILLCVCEELPRRNQKEAVMLQRLVRGRCQMTIKQLNSVKMLFCIGRFLTNHGPLGSHCCDIQSFVCCLAF